MKRYLFPIIIEVVGVSIISVGVGIEIAMGADIGYVLISVGSVTVAGGSLIWAKFMRR